MTGDQRAVRRIKLRELRILLAVIEAGSMARAATRLAISQPAVSKAIADLEHAVGARLLDRVARGVRPTAYSQVLLRHGAIIFDELGQAAKEIEFLKDPAAGELRVGSTEPITAGLVAGVIDRLTAKHPRATFHVRQSDTATLLFHDLRKRSLDLVIARVSPSEPEPDMAVDIVFEERLFVVAARNNRWATRRNVTLAELVDEPWILVPADSLAGVHAVEAFRASGLNFPQARVFSFSTSLRNVLLETGRFLTILPESMLSLGAKTHAMKVLPVAVPAKPRPIGIFTLRNRTLTPLASLFITMTREIAKRIELPRGMRKTGRRGQK